MKEYKYIIVGGGMTGSSAVMGIRKNDPDGTIAVISKEPYKPYNRPPLSKGLWDGKDIEGIMRPIEKYDVDLFLETRVERIEPDEKWILTDKDETFKYGKILIATGGEPIQLPGAPEGVISYRTRADYEELNELAKTKQTFCVIGGGFIGSEIAAALTKNDKDVTMIFPEIGISGLLFPDDLSKFLDNYYREQGVNILNGCLVDSISKSGDEYKVEFHNIDTAEVSKSEFDVIVVGIGLKPNLDLAKDAGLEVDDGILVNEFLQTSKPDIYAAGDVANFMNYGLKKRMRVEHEDNANTMGLIAGKNMAGDKIKYDHMPFFYSDLFDLGYEAVGEMNKDFTIVSDWIEPYKKGTIYYLDDNKIVGLIFWNLWGKVDQGREIIQEGKEYKDKDLKGLFTE
jgi:NADPH-dependent 2,4-dienoyl-CoA reductase/sulfur reductase-like enzyme